MRLIKRGKLLEINSPEEVKHLISLHDKEQCIDAPAYYFPEEFEAGAGWGDPSRLQNFRLNESVVGSSGIVIPKGVGQAFINPYQPPEEDLFYFRTTIHGKEPGIDDRVDCIESDIAQEAASFESLALEAISRAISNRLEGVEPSDIILPTIDDTVLLGNLQAEFKRLVNN